MGFLAKGSRRQQKGGVRVSSRLGLSYRVLVCGLLALVGLLSLATLASVGVAYADQPGKVSPGRVLVRFKKGVAPQAGLGSLGVARDRLEKSIPALGVVRVAVPPGQERQQAEQWRRHPAVEYAEPDGVVHLLEVAPTITPTLPITPNDSLFGQQWSLPRVRAPEAWGVVTGSASITIAVVDTGVSLSHPDLIGKLVLTTSMTNTINPAASPDDDHGHGSHVAGIAAAATNNGTGMAGIAWGARIMPVKVLDAQGSGTWSGVADGIVWAADRGAQVINLSLGGSGYSDTLAQAVAYAQARGTVVVAAMGNEGATVNYVTYPAAYPGVIAVAATTEADGQASFSSFYDHASLSAPGANIYSTVPTSTVSLADPSGYRNLSGTSMATPAVAGAAALVRSRHPEYTPAQVKSALEQSADDLSPASWDQRFGWGRLNLYRAVTLDALTTEVRGRVEDARGGVVAGAVVQAASITTTTGTDGAYRLVVPAGTHRVEASGANLGPGSPLTLSVSSGTWRAASFVLPPVTSTIASGGFETGLADWSPRGTPAPVLTSTQRFGGSYAAFLGYPETPEKVAAGTSTISQTVFIPGSWLSSTVTAPTLSFVYRLDTLDELGNDRFTVRLTRAGESTRWQTIMSASRGTGWQHVSYDLSHYAGQAIVLQFEVYNDELYATGVALDEVSLGPTAPTPAVPSVPPPPSGIGGPDAFGYTFRDNRKPGGPAFDWIAGSIDTGLTGDDAATDAIDLGFTFPFYGRTYTQVYVSSNGMLTLDTASAAFQNAPIPSSGLPNSLLAVYWDDLYVRSDSGVYYHRGGAAPHRYLVVEWRNVDHYDTSGRLTFAAILRESGEVIYLYRTLAGVLDASTVGIEDEAGLVGLQYAHDEPAVANGLAVGFYPPTTAALALSASPLAASIHSGQPVTYAVSLTNTGVATDSFDLAVASSRPEFGAALTFARTTPLPPGAATSFPLVVTPLTTTNGLTGVVTLAASSVGSPWVGQQLAVTTTVFYQPMAPVRDLRVTNVNGASFTVSWSTDTPVSGTVQYGVWSAGGAPVTLGTVGDWRGAGHIGLNHYVKIGNPNLEAQRTYWFAVLVGEATESSYRGQVTTGPDLTPGVNPKNIFGYVADRSGQPISGALLFLTLIDASGRRAASLSAAAEPSGYWSLNLEGVRTADLSAFFAYTSTDSLEIVVEARPTGQGYRQAAVGQSSPITVTVFPVVSYTLALGPGWNLVALPLRPVVTATVGDLVASLNQGGTRLVEFYRYRAGGWEGTLIAGAQVMAGDFTLQPGEGYFLRLQSAGTWSLSGMEVDSSFSLGLEPAWNLVGLPSAPAGLRAADVISQTAVVSPTLRHRVREIDRWVYGDYEGHVAGYPFNNFLIQPERGYFVLAAERLPYSPRAP